MVGLAAPDPPHELSVDQRVLVRVVETLQLKINVQLGPVEIAVVKQLHVEDVGYLGLSEPGIHLVIEKILPAADKDPDPVRRNVEHFSR